MMERTLAFLSKFLQHRKRGWVLANPPYDYSHMELKELGFDQWFEEKQEELQRPDCSVARVTAVNRDSYLVRNEKSEVLAELTGAFRFSAGSSLDFPSVGDWAFVQYYNADTFAIIRGLFPGSRSCDGNPPARTSITR